MHALEFFLGVPTNIPPGVPSEAPAASFVGPGLPIQHNGMAQNVVAGTVPSEQPTSVSVVPTQYQMVTVPQSTPAQSSYRYQTFENGPAPQPIQPSGVQYSVAPQPNPYMPPGPIIPQAHPGVVPRAPSNTGSPTGPPLQNIHGIYRPPAQISQQQQLPPANAIPSQSGINISQQINPNPHVPPVPYSGTRPIQQQQGVVGQPGFQVPSGAHYQTRQSMPSTALSQGIQPVIPMTTISQFSTVGGGAAYTPRPVSQRGTSPYMTQTQTPQYTGAYAHATPSPQAGYSLQSTGMSNYNQPVGAYQNIPQQQVYGQFQHNNMPKLQVFGGIDTPVEGSGMVLPAPLQPQKAMEKQAKEMTQTEKELADVFG